MKKIFFILGVVISFIPVEALWAKTDLYHVDQKEVYQGYIVKKISLTNFEIPKVTITGISYLTDVTLPKDAKTSDPQQLIVKICMERKRPFAIVRIPVFIQAGTGETVNMLSDFSLTVEEQKLPEQKPAAKNTDVLTSALASGTWHKIGITQTGFCKIDYNFISSLGVDPSKIDATKIRIYGNGGGMLSEDNNVSRPADLIENAIFISTAGSTFTKNDYIIFYGVGTTGWSKDSANQMFHHQVNLYADTACYFISFDNEGQGLRITQQSAIGAGNVTVNSYNYYDFHEVDLVDPSTFGKNWYGETFNPLLGNLSQSFIFNPGSYMDSVYCSVSFANIQSISGSSFAVSVNNSQVGTYVYSAATTGDNIMNIGNVAGKGYFHSQNLNIQVTFNPADLNSVGWLDYIELNGRRQLVISGDQMNFRDWKSVWTGNIANFQLQGASGVTSVWDVTDPQVPMIMAGSLSGNTYTFTQDAGILHEYALINSGNFNVPYNLGQVNNQNLHGSPQVDCIIVTYPDFFTQALQLAEFHKNHDGLRVIVATTQQVYNEFSSGVQDLCAIRDFERMFYKRAGTDTTQMPRFMVLLGGASYDYKNRISNNSNFVPVFESANSVNDLYSFSTDDFYGFLDDNEYIENTSNLNVLDIAVGRMPARSTADATNMINKIITYTSPGSLGPWRLSATFAADNDDAAGDHMQVAESMASAVTTCSDNLYNLGKVYLDALPAISTPAGTRCPNANAAIDNAIFQGTFVINYNGHGNTQVWSGDRILTQDDFNSWQNSNKMPFIITATCDFGEFDHPQYVSAAEKLVIENTAGAIVMLTTTQAVYSVYNEIINSAYLRSQFTKKANGKWNTFGEAETIAKNGVFTVTKDAQEIINFEKFALLGDPALTPGFPQYNIVMDSVIDGATLAKADTIKALGAYIMKGSVLDNSGSLLSGFTGNLTVTIYDKPRTILTTSGTKVTFQMQDNTIYKGNVSVANGKFSFTFITPKDIYYFYGRGKISTYAQNGITDGAGADTNYVVGGYSDNPVISTNPPIVRPYINDSLFHDGGITGSNTSLFVILNSKTGINVSGNGFGHDLTAILDGNVEQPYLLNDFYETAPNTYQLGYVNFPINGLAEGEHNIKVTAWDVNNNSGSGDVKFTVISGRVVDIQNLGNYPNPFSDNGMLTHFVFEHNHPFEQLDVKIKIYNTAGALVKNIQDIFTPQGSWSNDITWDGSDNSGAKLSAGVYVYRLNITTDRGFVSSAYQKLVIVR